MIYIITTLTLSAFTNALLSVIVYRSRENYREDLLYASVLSFLTAGGYCAVKMREIDQNVSSRWMWATIVASLGFMTSFWMYYFLDKWCIRSYIDDFSFSV
ncbi:MAG: hypothetical protein QW039_06300 [Fervidicoccaceae archaeon]